MRIAIDARKIELPLTGIGRYTKSLLAHLAATDKENEYVVLRGRGNPEELIQAENFRTVTVDYPVFSFRSLFWLHKALHREEVDVFHSPFISAPLFANCRVILTVHDLIPLKFTRSYGKGRKVLELLRRCVFRLILFIATRRADLIISVSQSSRKVLERLDSSLYAKISVIYEATDGVFRVVASEEEIDVIREKFNKGGKLILYVGSLRPHKNLIRLLKAVKLLICERKADCHLLITGGGGSDLFYLEHAADKLGISKHVSFIQNLSDNEIVTLMNAADVFVFPSLAEGFGLPPLEAMACGTPVISSDVSSLPEVLGDAALLVNPYNVKEIADAIDRLLLDAKLREELIKRGLERVKLFSWEKAAIETLEVYKAVMNKKN